MLVSEEEHDNRMLTLRDALMTLAPRERRILEARRFVEDPVTLEDLAIEFRVLRERVRQIEIRAFEKVSQAVRTNLVKHEASKHGRVVAAALPVGSVPSFP